MKTELIDILIQAGVIPQASLDEKYDSKAPFLEYLLAKGYGSEDDVIKILKNKLNFQIIDNKVLSNINLKILQSIPVNFILEYHILPFNVDDNSLNIVICDPTYDESINELAFLVDKHINIFAAKPSEINFNINKYFNVTLATNFKHFKTSHKSTNVIPKPSDLPELNSMAKLSEATKIAQKPSIPDPFSGTKTNIKIPETDLFDKTPMPKKPDFNPPSYEVQLGEISIVKAKKPDFSPNEGKKNPNPFKIHPDDIENELKSSQNNSKPIKYIDIDQELNSFDKDFKSTKQKKELRSSTSLSDLTYIKYFEEQKNILELKFESKISELKEKILKLEEEKHLSTIRKELEDKLQRDKTLEKINELEKIKDYNDLFLKIQSNFGFDKKPHNDSYRNDFLNLQDLILKIKEEQAMLASRIEKSLNNDHNKDNISKISTELLDLNKNIINDNINKEDLKAYPFNLELVDEPKSSINIEAKNFNKQNLIIDESKTDFSSISKIDNLIKDSNELSFNHILNKDIELEKIEKDHTVIEEILLESNFLSNKTNTDTDLSVNDTTVIRNLKEEIDSIPPATNLKTGLSNAPDLNLDNIFVENININTKNITEAKTKDELIQKALFEIQKISNKAILLFVRFENIIGISGAGDKILENVNTYKDTILIPSMFKKVYDTKSVYTGPATEDNIVKNFYLHFNMSRPETLTIAPLMLKKRVFGMLYLEGVKDLDTLNKITKAISSSLESVFNK